MADPDQVERAREPDAAPKAGSPGPQPLQGPQGAGDDTPAEPRAREAEGFSDSEDAGLPPQGEDESEF